MVLSMAAAVLAPLSASASTTSVTGTRVAAVSHTSFTVTVKSMGKGWKYRLYASTHRPDIYDSNLSNGKAKHSTLNSKPSMTIGGLGYTTKLYWFRVRAVNGTRHRLGPQYTIGLRPSVPTSLSVSSTPGQGTSLTWSNGSVTGFTVQRADDAGFTQGVVSYSMRGATHQFTPTGMANGATYYFRVRAINNTTPSSFTTPVSTVAASNEQSVRVMTYNILAARATQDPGGTISPWSDRRTPAANLIKQGAPDLVAVQEASDFIGSDSTCAGDGRTSPRQVDDLVRTLGGAYSLAPTEWAPCQQPSGQSWFRGANYILYNPSTYSVVDAWHFVVDTVNGTEKWAPWAVMQNTATGAKLMFVAPHILVGSKASQCGGTDCDQRRETETQSLIQQATSYAAQHGNLPIVYAGDYNSHSGHAVDGPAIAMRAVNNADGEYVAQSLANHKFNSANDYYRTPPAFARSIDHVFTSPGVGVTSWRLLLNLSSGKFVGTIPSDHNPLVADVVFPY
jgi:endonuclease/exonuclease/phosphatase family metal-dependent hydrolase